ncbi:MAG TPA: hypothetical protein VHH36_07385 [Candidatus Thermoplasmatota archaeon]|nr:hypothetical protein [Candidatus Thermoplasmatota archaeon]
MALDALAAPLAVLAGLFLLSSHLTARAIAQESRQARSLGLAPPRILRWYVGVVRRSPWIAGAGALLLGGGVALAIRGRDEAAQGAVLAGAAVLLYVAQAWWVVVAERRSRAG